MLSLQQRMFLFLFGCIGARLLLAALIATARPAFLPALSVLTGAMALGFLAIWLFGWRKTGLETGGKPIWWNHLRPVHFLFYATAAVLIWRNSRRWAAALIAADALLGLVAFAMHHRLLIW